MPSATTPLAQAGKAAEGEPRVRRPAARLQTEPLAEGGFVLKRLHVLVAAAVVALTVSGPAVAEMPQSVRWTHGTTDP